MNQRLTATGKKMLRVSLRLSQLPQPAPVPRAFASLLTDPAELLEKIWSVVLSSRDTAPDFPDGSMPSAASGSLDIPQHSSLRRDKMPIRQPQNLSQNLSQTLPQTSPQTLPQTLFEAAANPAFVTYGFAAAGEPLLPATLRDATFRTATAKRRFSHPILKQNAVRSSATLTHTAFAPLHRENPFPGQTAQATVKPLRSASNWPDERAIKETSEPSYVKNDSIDQPITSAMPKPSHFEREPITNATPEPFHSKGEPTTNAMPEPSHSKSSTQLTRNSARLAALLNANLRTQAEQPQSANFDSAPDSPPRGRQSLNLIRSAANSPRPIADIEPDAPASLELIPAETPPIHRGLIQRFSDSELVPRSIETEPATEPITPAATSLPTVESVLEELYERLRVEFLRTYGSSGG